MVVLIGIAVLVATVTLGACTTSRSWLVYFDALAGQEAGPLESQEPDSSNVELHDVIPEALAHNVAL